MLVRFWDGQAAKFTIDQYAQLRPTTDCRPQSEFFGDALSNWFNSWFSENGRDINLDGNPFGGFSFSWAENTEGSGGGGGSWDGQ